MIILASQSPRRRELLQKLNIPFVVRVADVDETLDKTLSLEGAVAQLSLRKAASISREKGDIVIAADTIVVLDGNVLGKPRNREDAKRMLLYLSGRTHQVMTGVTVLQDYKHISHTEVTEVTFRRLTISEINRYVASGDCDDKAGSYGIQSGAAAFVEKINGDYFNVVGLPVCRLSLILKEFAV